MDPIMLTLRVLVSLGAVLAVLWLAQKYTRKRLGTSRSGALLQVVARQGIAQKASLVIVDAEGKRFVLGVTEQSINVLHTSDAPEGEPAAESQSSFSGLLAKASGDEFPNSPPQSGSLLSTGTWKQAAAAVKTGKLR